MRKLVILVLTAGLFGSSVTEANLNSDLASDEQTFEINQNYQIYSEEIEVELPVWDQELEHAHPENDESASLFFYEDGKDQVPIINPAVFIKNFSKLSLWPLDGIVTSQYGVARGGRKVATSAKGKKKFVLHYTRHHEGIDIAAPVGSPIVAPSAAIVKFVGVKGGYGKTIILDHGQDITSLYAHNSEIYVQEGDKVEAGQLISRVGMTGRSTGPHLHFEIRKSDQPVNPYQFLHGKAKVVKGFKTAELDY